MKCCLTSKSANGLKRGKVKHKCIIAPSPRWKVINENRRKSWLWGRRTDSQRCHLNLPSLWGAEGAREGRLHEAITKWVCDEGSHSFRHPHPLAPVASPSHLVSVLPLGSPPTCQENYSLRLHLRSTVLTSLTTNKTASWAVTAARSSALSSPAGQRGYMPPPPSHVLLAVSFPFSEPPTATLCQVALSSCWINSLTETSTLVPRSPFF